ncbi:RNA polymerase subunit AC19 [Lambiella insularis]|nr:RNA polymerase subunit AC19 [Lambiella insularis]
MPSQPAIETQDQSIPDAAANSEVPKAAGEIVELGKQRVRVVRFLSHPKTTVNSNDGHPQLPGASDTAASFEFEGEDHTLGNALRYMIMKNLEVEFCGYSIPHPSEAKMNVRIQTYEGTTVFDALDKGFDDLVDLCDVVTEKFTSARDMFMAEQHE